MYCTNCGKKIPAGNRFCPYCGNPAPEEIRTGNGEKKAVRKPGTAVIAAISAGAVLLLALSVWIGSAVIGSIRGQREREDGAAPDAGSEQIEPLRDISEQSEIYREAYLDTLGNMDAIIASYWESGDEIDRMFDSMRGTTEQFHDTLRELDPGIYDALSDTAAEEAGHNELDSHLIKKGVDAYFSDTEIGRELRSVGESLFLGLMEGLFRYGEDTVRKDLLVAVSVNGNYALMRTHGTLGDLVGQLRDDSGYSMAMPALRALHEELFDYSSENITREMDIVFNGREGADEIRDKWDRINGRLHALEDSMAVWEENMEKWTAAFLADLGVTEDQTTGAERVYCTVERDGRQHCLFVEEGLSGFRIGSDGRFSYRKGSATVLRDHDGTLVWTGEGEISFSRCGNAFRITEENDFQNGGYRVLELVRPDGSMQRICRGYDLIVYDCGRGEKPDGYRNEKWNTGTVGGSDFWAAEYRALENGTRVESVVNAKTGQVMERGAFDEADGAEQAAEHARDMAVINDRYALKYDTWELCDGDGNTVRTLGDGQGVAAMYYAEDSDRYWIRTNTGYCYVLDGALARVGEPIQMSGDFYAFTPYGVLLLEEGKLRLYDEKGNRLAELPGTTVWGFVGGTVKSTWGGLDLDSRQHDMSFNLNTREQMFLSLPGAGND